MSEYYGKDEKPERIGLIGRRGIIKRSDNLIALGDMEKAWQAAGKLKFVARHKRFTYDPRVTYLVQGVLPMQIIKDVLYECAGAVSPEEYQIAMDEVYGKPVDGSVLMFLHFGDFK